MNDFSDVLITAASGGTLISFETDRDGIADSATTIYLYQVQHTDMTSDHFVF